MFVCLKYLVLEIPFIIQYPNHSAAKICLYQEFVESRRLTCASSTWLEIWNNVNSSQEPDLCFIAKPTLVDRTLVTEMWSMWMVMIIILNDLFNDTAISRYYTGQDFRCPWNVVYSTYVHLCEYGFHRRKIFKHANHSSNSLYNIVEW